MPLSEITLIYFFSHVWGFCGWKYWSRKLFSLLVLLQLPHAFLQCFPRLVISAQRWPVPPPRIQPNGCFFSLSVGIASCPLKLNSLPPKPTRGTKTGLPQSKACKKSGLHLSSPYSFELTSVSLPRREKSKRKRAMGRDEIISWIIFTVLLEALKCLVKVAKI